MYSGIDSASIQEQVIDIPPVRVVLPRVQGLWNKTIEEKINLVIEEKVNNIIRAFGGQRGDLLEMTGGYRVTLNQKGLLSLRFEILSQIKNAAHPITIIRSLTVDLNTGKVYELYDLFRSMVGHAITITKYILREVEKQKIPLIIDLKLIPDNHPYYLTEDSLVIYFQEASLAPRDYGILEFPMPIILLSSLMENPGPLPRLLK